MVGVHSDACRGGGVGVVGPAVVPRSVRYVVVVEGRHAVLVLVAAASGSVERSAGRAVTSVDRA